jgi:hypothetical protein
MIPFEHPYNTLDSAHVKAHRCAGGGKGIGTGIGAIKGGWRGKFMRLSTSIMPLVGDRSNARQVADCTVGLECMSLIAAGIKALIGDKAYDSDSFRPVAQALPVALSAMRRNNTVPFAASSASRT